MLRRRRIGAPNCRTHRSDEKGRESRRSSRTMEEITAMNFIAVQSRDIAQSSKIVHHSANDAAAGPEFSVKRIFDIFAAGLALLILLPVFVVVAIAIKLEDPGPVLFS